MTTYDRDNLPASGGFPYPVAADVHATTYEPA